MGITTRWKYCTWQTSWKALAKGDSKTLNQNETIKRGQRETDFWTDDPQGAVRILKIRATRKAHNPNLPVVTIAHARQIGSQHSFGLHNENEWNAQNVIWSGAFEPCTTRIPITCVMTFYLVKLKRSTAFDQEQLYWSRLRLRPRPVSFGFY